MQATASKSRRNSSLDLLMVASMVENLDVLKDCPDDALKQQRIKELKMKFNSSCISSSGIYTRAGPLRGNVDTIVTKFLALPKALREAMFSDVGASQWCVRRPSHSWRWCRTVVALSKHHTNPELRRIPPTHPVIPLGNNHSATSRHVSYICNCN